LRLILITLAAATALASCAEQTPAPAPADDIPAPVPAEPRPTPPAGPDAPAAPVPTDDCGAAERQDWIGRARSDLPSPPDGALWRVYETGQPVTQDLRPNRLNIEIDPDSQTVVRLSCG
jgi:hypothetical protein